MLVNKSHLMRMIVPAQARCMASATHTIKDRFEAAHQARTAALNKVQKKA